MLTKTGANEDKLKDVCRAHSYEACDIINRPLIIDYFCVWLEEWSKSAV